MDYLEDNFDTGQHEDGLYKFKSVMDYRGPYTCTGPEYLGSSYNLLIEWETGEMTCEPLSNIIADDPYSCAVYAEKFDLLNTQGWKQLKIHPRTTKRLIRALEKSKYRQAKASRRRYAWMGSSIRLYKLDVQNGNNKWRDAIDMAIEQIKEYQVFKDHDKAVYEKNKVINAPWSIKK